MRMGRNRRRAGIVSCIMSGVKRRTWLVTAALLLAAVVTAGVLSWRGAERQPGASGSHTSGSSTPVGWRTIEYRGVRVDIPADWQQEDLDSCEFQFEHWAPSDSKDCDPGGSGVTFYGSVTFDPFYAPGVRSSEFDADEAWVGYAYAGDYAVHVAGDDRRLVARVLRSARSADPSSD